MLSACTILAVELSASKLMTRQQIAWARLWKFGQFTSNALSIHCWWMWMFSLQTLIEGFLLSCFPERLVSWILTSSFASFSLSLPCATYSFFCSGYSVSLSPAFSFKLLFFKPLLLFLFFSFFVSARLGFSQGFTMLIKSVSLFLQVWIEYLVSTFSMAHHSDQGLIIPWRCTSYLPVKSKEIKCQLVFYTYTCKNVTIKTICGCLWLWDIFTGEAELWYSLKVTVQKILKVSSKFKKQKHIKSFTLGWKWFLTKVSIKRDFWGGIISMTCLIV